MNWQPIETAPKDGTPLLLFCNPTPALSGHMEPDEVFRSRMTTGYFDKHYHEWWLCVFWGYESEATLYEDPTHWMPLPEPPNEA